MIIELTIDSEVFQIDTSIINYGYNDGGLKLALSSVGLTYNPSAEIFENNNVTDVTLPTYADFVIATSNYFLELASTAWTVINVNLSKIQRLVAIDSSNTTIYFSKYSAVDVNVGMAAIITAINGALNINHADEDIVSDGSGVIPLAHNYISGSWKVYLRGALVRKADVTETGADELTISVFTRSGDFINVTYNY